MFHIQTIMDFGPYCLNCGVSMIVFRSVIVYYYDIFNLKPMCRFGNVRYLLIMVTGYISRTFSTYTLMNHIFDKWPNTNRSKTIIFSITYTIYIWNQYINPLPMWESRRFCNSWVMILIESSLVLIKTR